MSGKKKIPCRVCGKEFTPCTYCQTHADVFRWRNFACSIECAQKYINDTITYRASKKATDKSIVNVSTTEEETTKKVSSKRKYTRKTSPETNEETSN